MRGEEGPQSRKGEPQRERDERFEILFCFDLFSQIPLLNHCKSFTKWPL